MSSLPQALRAPANEHGSQVLTCSTGEQRDLCLPGVLLHMRATQSRAPQLSASHTSPEVCIQGPITPLCTTEMQRVQMGCTNLHLSGAAPGHAAFVHLPSPSWPLASRRCSSLVREHAERFPQESRLLQCLMTGTYSVSSFNFFFFFF